MPTVTDWTALLAFAEKQSLIGICLPSECPENLSKDLLLQWIGQVQLIEQQNKLLNRRIGQLFKKLEDDGFRCCLLKGQGNAALYPKPLMRCAGDIDVWIDSDVETVYQYVRQLFPDAEETYKHIHFPLFDDAPVDVHITPLRFYSGLYEKRLQRWIGNNKDEQFVNYVRLSGTDREVSVPTANFNAVYQLGHMMVHLFDEGLGMRQVVDYYYVLKQMDLSDKEKAEFKKTFEELGMLRFAKAMMWIQSDVLGLPFEKCIISPDEKRGKKVFQDILEGGNFGHHSQRYDGKKGFYERGLAEAWRNVKLLSLAPREGTARLFYRIGTAMRHPLK